MKVAIGYKIIEGPWGGGNNFVRSLSTSLIKLGHTVVFSLNDNNIDVIVMIDPRSRIPNIPFGSGDILRYLSFINPNAVVLHRINECDERKKTRTMNFRLRLANYAADHTVFVGSWLKNLNLWRVSDGKPSSVILNGADPDFFNHNGQDLWNGNSPLKLVTHHWGGNWMKGFDVYQKVDDMLADDKWSSRIEFTYIGNVPDGFKFKNANHLPAMDSANLAKELPRHHVYLTASINEPGGNHQNEGALCGLPILYRNSGCMPEYCDGFGTMFTNTADFELSLNKMMDDYYKWHQRVQHYPYTVNRTMDLYIKLIEKMYREREKIERDRSIWNNPAVYLLNQIVI